MGISKEFLSWLVYFHYKTYITLFRGFDVKGDGNRDRIPKETIPRKRKYAASSFTRITKEHRFNRYDCNLTTWSHVTKSCSMYKHVIRETLKRMDSLGILKGKAAIYNLKIQLRPRRYYQNVTNKMVWRVKLFSWLFSWLRTRPDIHRTIYYDSTLLSCSILHTFNTPFAFLLFQSLKKVYQTENFAVDMCNNLLYFSI